MTFPELKAVIQTLQANEQTLQSRYETAEIERVKAVNAEHHGGSESLIDVIGF
jgi:hypothetical protein